jgi:hypothetical protein
MSQQGMRATSQASAGGRLGVSMRAPIVRLEWQEVSAINDNGYYR